MKKYYQGICDKFGGFPNGTALVVGSGWVLGQGLNTIFNIAGGSALFSNADLMHWATIGGALLGVAAHSALNATLSGKGIGLTRGSQIVKRAQALCYALPVAAALAFNAVSDKELIDDYIVPLADEADVLNQPVVAEDYHQFHSVQSEPVLLPSQSRPS